jgi:hypothetical protein
MPDGTGGTRTRDRQIMITIELRPAPANQTVTRTCVAEGVPSRGNCAPPGAQMAVWWITLGIRPAPKPYR